MKSIDTGLPWITITIEDRILVVSSDKLLTGLSSAITHGGYHRTRHLLNMTVPSGYISDDPKEDILAAAVRRGAHEPIGMMTAADVGKAVFVRDGSVLTVVTAGTSNAATPGEKAPVWGAGTVNIMVVVDHPMTDAALANALITITEAKTHAFRILDIRSTNAGGMATGTTTDSVAVCMVDGEGEPYRYASTATEVGRTIGSVVFSAVLQCLSTHNGTPARRDVRRRLRERGIDTSAVDGLSLGAREHMVLVSLVSVQDDPAFEGDGAAFVSHMASISESLLGICQSEIRTLHTDEKISFENVAVCTINDILAARGGGM